MRFYPALLLIKELTSQPMKYSNGTVLTALTGLAVFPTILKGLA